MSKRINGSQRATVAFIATKTTSQTGVAAGTVITFPVELLDTHSAYDTATSRFTAPVAGAYQVQAEAFANSSANTGFIINIQKNGAIYARAGNGTGAAMERSSLVSSLIPLDVGDYIDVRVQFIAGSSAIEGAVGHVFSGYLVSAT